jgi:hypothetical protein
MPNKSYAQIYIDILKSNKYSMTMILIYDTNHYRDSTIHKYHMHILVHDTYHYGQLASLINPEYISDRSEYNHDMQIERRRSNQNTWT